MILNEEQQRAVESQSQFTLVVASPGSGKTAVLAARIAHLCYTVEPSRLVAITYTNAAARELQARVNTAIGSAVTLGFVGTIHGYALRVLSHYGYAIGLSGRVGVMDEQQAEEILTRQATDLHYKGTKKDLDAAVAARLLQVPFTGAAVGRPGGALALSKAELVAFAYVDRMLADGAFSFDALIAFATFAASRSFEPLGEDVAELLVDEYQDATDLTHGLCMTHPGRKFFVGDPDQAIFGFAGGESLHIVMLARAPDWNVIPLLTGYRCSFQICQAANALIVHNRSRFPKYMLPAREKGDPPMMAAQFESAAAELSWVMSEISILNPKQSETVAVLCRFNAQVNEVADYLRGVGLPVRTREERSAPKDWPTVRRFVALASAPENDTLAYWFVSLTRGARFAANIRLGAAEGGTSINRHFLKMPDKLAAVQVPDVLARIDVSPEAIALVRRALEGLPDGADAGDLAVALGNPALHTVDVGDGIAVSTIHSFKGREADHVFVLGCDDVLMPGMGKKVGSALEEERRVFFVAITRARRRLVLTTSKLRRIGPWQPKAEPASPSRFIAEAGLKL